MGAGRAGVCKDGAGEPRQALEQKARTGFSPFQMVRAFWILLGLSMSWSGHGDVHCFLSLTGLSGSPAAEPCRAHTGLLQVQPREAGGHE